jgi:hypothetical protein
MNLIDEYLNVLDQVEQDNDLFFSDEEDEHGHWFAEDEFEDVESLIF